MTEKRAVVLLSGGLDSTTAAALARREGWALYGLTVRYGQVHAQEIAAARRVAQALGFVAPRRARCRPARVRRLVARRRRRDSELARPANSPTHQLERHRQIPSTYVPARNTVFLSLALGWAEVVGASNAS